MEVIVSFFFCLRYKFTFQLKLSSSRGGWDNNYNFMNLIQAIVYACVKYAQNIYNIYAYIHIYIDCPCIHIHVCVFNLLFIYWVIC